MSNPSGGSVAKADTVSGRPVASQRMNLLRALAVVTSLSIGTALSDAQEQQMIQRVGRRACLWWLHVEKIEVHSVASLDARNQVLYRSADEQGLDAYDGMDVGPVKRACSFV